MIEKNKIYCPSRDNARRKTDSLWNCSEDESCMLDESFDEDGYHTEDLGYEISIRKVAEWMHDDATVIFHDVLHAQCCFDSTDTGYDT